MDSTFGDHGAMMGEWMIGDDITTLSNLDSKDEKKSEPTFAVNADLKDLSNSNGVAQTTVGNRGGLWERRAGFNAQRLDPESMKPPTYFCNDPGVRSPLYTASSDFSPTILLDSPVFLTNSLAVPSPTTGKFSLLADNSGKGKENSFENINSSSFGYKPVAGSGPHSYYYPVNKVNLSGFAPQTLPSVGISVNLDTSSLHQSIELHSQNFQQSNFTELHKGVNGSSNLTSKQTCNTVDVVEQQFSSPLDEITYEDDGDVNADEDGYNWRKYGQKQVKGSEYPRSYFKCTFADCPVKKKMERSPEGHITEIVYKGSHNHSKPSPPPLNRRSPAFASSNSLTEMQFGAERCSNGVDSDLTWSTLQNVNALRPFDQNMHSGPTKYEQLHSSSNLINDEDDNDRATHGSGSFGYDGEGEESESKRRRIECYASDVTGATRPIREPRVVVQTTSEVDILDDGYRWRKYGQKVVKGNPNPRSYYKCTSPNCNVRKHVERASHDLKAVITTYEGKHNHEVPAPRNSSHINSMSSSSLLHNTNQTAAASRFLHKPKPSQIRMPQFERGSLGMFGFPGRPPFRPGFGFGINQPGLSNFGLDGNFIGFGLNPYLQHQARPISNVGFAVPKLEGEMEIRNDASLVDQADALFFQQYLSQMQAGTKM